MISYWECERWFPLLRASIDSVTEMEVRILSSCTVHGDSRSGADVPCTAVFAHTHSHMHAQARKYRENIPGQLVK